MRGPGGISEGTNRYGEVQDQSIFQGSKGTGKMCEKLKARFLEYKFQTIKLRIPVTCFVIA